MLDIQEKKSSTDVLSNRNLCEEKNCMQPSHHSKIVEDKPPTIDIINSNVPWML
jgi:hypothetical protein